MVERSPTTPQLNKATLLERVSFGTFNENAKARGIYMYFCIDLQVLNSPVLRKPKKPKQQVSQSMI